MTNKITRTEDYKDLDLDFLAHPTTGDIVKKTGADAIKRSVRNLILSNFYERPFRSYIGSNAQKILFDNINPFTAQFLKDAIRDVITNFEPRVKFYDDENRGILVQVDPDNNGYIVKLSFIVVNRGEPLVISMFLKRLR